MAIARREHFGYLLEPGLREIFYETYDQLPDMVSDIFNVQTTNNPYETDVSIGTMGEFPEFAGTVEYDRPYQGYKQVYEFPEFAKGFRIERKMWDDDRYNEINKRPQGLAISAQRRRQQDAAKIFNNAFDSDYEGPDGEPLCSETHPSPAPDGPSARVNKDTKKLNHDNLQDIKNEMRQFVDDRGGKISVVPDTLIVPVSLEEMGWQIITADGKLEADHPGTNPNIHQGRYRLIVWDYLDDTGDPDTAKWFLCDSRYMNMFLNWFDRVPLEFAMEEDFDTLVAKFRAYMRYAAGWSDWVWVFGNDPTA